MTNLYLYDENCIVTHETFMSILSIAIELKKTNTLLKETDNIKKDKKDSDEDFIYNLEDIIVLIKK